MNNEQPVLKQMANSDASNPSSSVNVDPSKRAYGVNHSSAVTDPALLPSGSRSDVQNIHREGPSEQKKRGFCSYVMMGCLSVILVLMIVIIVLAMVVAVQYRSYANSITKEGDPTYLVSTTDLTEEERTSLQDRLTKFQEQQSETTFIQFEPRELGILIFTIVEEQSTQPISLEAVHVRPSEGQWDLSFKLAWEGHSLPWATIEVFKEDQESAELYFPRIVFAGIDLEDVGFGFVADRINEGYRDALLISDEGSVTSRFYENIELTEDTVIIKTRAVEPDGEN